MVLDDIENDENVRTVEQRKKLENWFYKAVSKAGDTYTDIVYIGTLLHYDSLLAKVLKNPAYRSVKYKAVQSFPLRRCGRPGKAFIPTLATRGGSLKQKNSLRKTGKKCLRAPKCCGKKSSATMTLW